MQSPTPVAYYFRPSSARNYEGRSRWASLGSAGSAGSAGSGVFPSSYVQYVLTPTVLGRRRGKGEALAHTYSVPLHQARRRSMHRRSMDPSPPPYPTGLDSSSLDESDLVYHIKRQYEGEYDVGPAYELTTTVLPYFRTGQGEMLVLAGCSMRQLVSADNNADTLALPVPCRHLDD